MTMMNKYITQEQIESAANAMRKLQSYTYFDLAETCAREFGLLVLEMNDDQLARAKEVIASGEKPHGWDFHTQHIDEEMNRLGINCGITRPLNCVICQRIVDGTF